MSTQAAQPSTFFLDAVAEAVEGKATIVTGTLTSGSTGITALGSLAGVGIGATILAPDVPTSPPTTVVAASDSAHTATMSAAAAAAHAAIPITFEGPPPITSLLVGLFTNTPALSPDTVLADLVEPTYTGYARVPVAIGSRRSNSNEDVIEPVGSASFQPTDDVGLPQTANGVFLAGTIGGVVVLLLFENFDAAFNFNTHLNGLTINLDLFFRNGPYWGGICSTC